ncbi:MAG: addiction module protein [Gammaproteobacteria bacterium]|nr:addiction module protein [Gammaproteobacteria bacterium]
MEIDVAKLLALPPAERAKLAQVLWNSIPDNAGPEVLPISDAERVELERRLAEYPEDDTDGRPVDEVMADLRRELCRGT